MASKVQKLELFATLEWAKVFESNRDRAEWNAETDGEYKITMYLDEENAAKLKKAGCGKKMEKTEQGTKVTVGRKHRTEHEWQCGEPKIAKANGTLWDLASDGYIGNGSTGFVTVSIYPTRTGRTGTRLESVQVINAVTYDSGNGSGFQDRSSLSSEPVSAKTSSKVVVDEDSIPF